MISELNERSREILRLIVEGYVDTGGPVGSRTLSRKLNMKLSPATVRNTMADLEDLGLLYAPHTSAGRLPTEAGLRLFVDGLLELGNLTEDERKAIEAKCKASGRSYNQVLEEASGLLSGLSHCAGLVMSPKTEGGCGTSNSSAWGRAVPWWCWSPRTGWWEPGDRRGDGVAVLGAGGGDQLSVVQLVGRTLTEAGRSGARSPPSGGNRRTDQEGRAGRAGGVVRHPEDAGAEPAS